MINYSPLYYAAAAAAYRLSPATDLFDRAHAMRVVSALLMAATVFLVFLFLRELLPATPWAWPVGAVAVAFQPLFGFIGGGVNNDNLVITAATGTLLALAICFRRGLTPRRGLLLGALRGRRAAGKTIDDRPRPRDRARARAPDPPGVPLHPTPRTPRRRRWPRRPRRSRS